jgi:hypothetical protein
MIGMFKRRFSDILLCPRKQSDFQQLSSCHFPDAPNWHGRCDTHGAHRESRPVREVGCFEPHDSGKLSAHLFSGKLPGDQTMRSRTVSEAFAEVTLISEEQTEQLRPATYRETAAAIFMALAESELGHDPSDEGAWDCEIELLEEDYDADAQVSNVTIPTKH